MLSTKKLSTSCFLLVSTVLVICNYKALRAVSAKHGLGLVADAAHSLGAFEGGVPVGKLADLTTFSFHPVKAITTGEGGMVVTEDDDLAHRMRSFRNHGINIDHHQRAHAGRWDYTMDQLGFNYRLTDIQCALGLSQLKKLPGWLGRRREIAKRYDQAFSVIEGISPLHQCPDVEHVYHLYVIKVDLSVCGMDRDTLFAALREKGIGVNVHYAPVYQHQYYQDLQLLMNMYLHLNQEYSMIMLQVHQKHTKIRLNP